MTVVRINLIKMVGSKVLGVSYIVVDSVQFISLMTVMMMLVASIVFFPRKTQKGVSSPGPFLPQEERRTFVVHLLCAKCTYIILLVLQTASGAK